MYASLTLGSWLSTGEEVEKAIRELPRDPDVITLYKKFAEPGPLPPR